MLSAESAVLVHFQSVRTILLVLGGVVISLFAFRARQGNFGLHCFHLVHPNSKTGFPQKTAVLPFTQIKPLHRGKSNLPYFKGFVNVFFEKNRKFFQLFLLGCINLNNYTRFFRFVNGKFYA